VDDDEVIENFFREGETQVECRYCGSAIPVGCAMFCPNCGTEYVEHDFVEADDEVSPSEADEIRSAAWHCE
jgi:DNA-directed RNA polymerase subunit RPC12/RpoP